MVAAPDTDEAGRLRLCIRDLVALSTMPTWWIGRSPHALAESLRDLLRQMLDARIVCVQVADPANGQPITASAGAPPVEIEAALTRRSVDKPQTALLEIGDAIITLERVPVGVDGEDGFIAVGSTRADFPDELDALLMRVAANQLSIGLQHTGLIARHQHAEHLLAEQALQQQSVAQLGIRALTGVSLGRLLSEVVEVVRSTLRADFCAVLELTSSADALLLKAVSGATTELIRSTRVSASPEFQPGYTLQVNRPVAVLDTRRDTRFALLPLFADESLVSGASVVIYGQHGPFGVLVAHTRDARAFTGDEMFFLQSVANLLAAALQRRDAEAERESLLARTLGARLEAEKASRNKSEFLATMSHELRTPLATISGYLDLLEDEAHGPLTRAQKEDLHRIRRCEQYLLSMINNVLSLMKLGSGHNSFSIARVPVDETLAYVEDLIRPQMDARGLRFERHDAGPGITVRADRDKLEQILLNLLSNAAKFTAPGGVVRLDCVVEGSDLHFRVWDNGRGIPEHQLESVFEPYVQVDPSQARDGAGLGLTISRELARGMGGEIVVRSRLGEGSEFSLVLPLDA